MSQHSPALMMFGAMPVISPTGTHRIRADLWPELAIAVLMDPEPELQAVWLGNLERKLGVTEDHRATLAERAIGAAETAEQRRLREEGDRRRAAAIGAPLRDPYFVAAVSEKHEEAAHAWADVEEARAVAVKKADRRRVKGLEAIARRVERELDELRQQELAQAQLYGVASDQIIMARMRGEEVIAVEVETAEIARDEHGARIVHKRGTKKGLPVLVYDRGLRAKKLAGLEHAFVSGYLDGGRGASHPERLKGTGEAYGEAYEIDEGQRSGGGAMEGGGGGGFGPKGPQFRIVDAGFMLDEMRKGMGRRERRVLDLVCGQHMRAREAATIMGAGFPATVRALRAGLKLAGENWRAALHRRKELGGESASDQVRAAHEVLSRMRAG